MNILTLKKIVRWTLFVLVFLFIISGLGITQWQIMEKITLGILTKAISFKIHSKLLIPFLIILIWHMFFNEINKLITKIK